MHAGRLTGIHTDMQIHTYIYIRAHSYIQGHTCIMGHTSIHTETETYIQTDRGIYAGICRATQTHMHTDTQAGRDACIHTYRDRYRDRDRDRYIY